MAIDKAEMAAFSSESVELWCCVNLFCIVIRTILALRYWILGDIRIIWIVSLLGDFFHCDTQYDTNQTAVGTVHMITILTSVFRPLSADDGRDSGERV